MHTDKLVRPAPPRSTNSMLARLARFFGGGRALTWALRGAPVVLAGALGAAVVLAPAPAAAQSKVAVVDVRRAVLETEEGLRVQATLKKLFDSRQVELDGKQRALLEEQDKLEKEVQAGKAPKDALQRKRETWQRQAAELQSTIVDYQREMQRKESELTTPILQKVLGIVRRIAAQEGYEMIMEKSAVPYFRADLEVTDRVIQMYNGGQTGDAPSKGAAPAQQPAPQKPAAPAPPSAPAPKKK